MQLKKTLITAACLVSLAGLSACKTAEEQAEEHFQQGLTLLETGDAERAQVEFRNVLALDEDHREARLTYAQTSRDQGKYREAYGQYLRHVEFYPEDLDARRALAEMALETFKWKEVERHIEAAAKIAPEDLGVRAIQTSLAYRNALKDENTEMRKAAAKEAEALKQALPDNLIVRRIVIDELLRSGKQQAALAEIDKALSLHDKDMPLYRIRMSLLNQMGDDEALEKQLVRMVDLFPQDTETRKILISWYLSRKELDKAEAFLRQRAQVTGSHVDLVNFLAKVRGPEVARAELEIIIASEAETELYRAIRASLDFDAGKRSEAIAELEDIVATGQSSEQLRNIKMNLVRMRSATGNHVGARALVEEVLNEDPTKVEALKLKANWLIDADQADQAIIVLRSALDQSPNDAKILTLMARAYERNGSRELVGETLALAVDASNAAPGESLRYASFLIADDNDLAAENVLITALRNSPNDLKLLSALGEVYLRIADWPRAQQIVDTLAKLDEKQASSMATGLKLAILKGQDRSGEAMAFLESMAAESENALPVQIAIIRTHIANGEMDKAEKHIREALAENPESRMLRALSGRFLEQNDKPEEAVRTYQTLLEENPKDEAVWRELYTSLTRANRLPEAEQALDQALAVFPDSGTLQWMKASLLEKRGDIDAAIAVYEDLYAKNSNSPVVANNLASLITTYKDDPESLERAYVIARRLRALDQPAFQDTYGWIAYRRGDYEEALTFLESAAEKIENDPGPAFHLGMTYLALKRIDEAKGQFQKAVSLANDGDTRPDVARAREELARIEAETEN